MTLFEPLFRASIYLKMKQRKTRKRIRKVKFNEKKSLFTVKCIQQEELTQINDRKVLIVFVKN